MDALIEPELQVLPSVYEVQSLDEMILVACVATRQPLPDQERIEAIKAQLAATGKIQPTDTDLQR